MSTIRRCTQFFVPFVKNLLQQKKYFPTMCLCCHGLQNKEVTYNYKLITIFFSERAISIVVPIIFAIFVLVGVIGNLLVLIVVAFKQQMRNTTNVLIVVSAIQQLMGILHTYVRTYDLVGFDQSFSCSDYINPDGFLFHINHVL